MLKTPRIVFAVIVLLLWPGVAAADDLSDQLTTFFTATKQADRQAARKAILNTPKLTHKKLESAIRKLALWPAKPRVDAPLAIPLGSEQHLSVQVHVRLPQGYSPGKAWPLIVAFHGQGQSPPAILDYTIHSIGPKADEFILAAPQDMDGPGFSGTIDQEMRMFDLLVELRKRFRIDNDQVFVTGYSLGGHRAWLAAVQDTDCLAGAMPLSGTLLVPGGDALYVELLDNTRHLPMLVVWGEKDVLERDGKPVKDSGIHGGNVRLESAAKMLKLKHYTSIMLAGAGHLDVRPPQQELAALLSRKRERYPRDVHKGFRYAQNSSMYWIRTQRLNGKPIPSGQIRAARKPEEDEQTAVARYLREHLGLLEGTVKGPDIVIRSQRCSYIDLLLHDDLLDLDKPVTITRNKNKLFEGKVERDLGVTLDEAALTWDFERLPRAKVIVPVASKARVVKSVP